MDNVKNQRMWMKSNFTEWDDIMSDQEKKLPQPPLEKSYDEGGIIIDLPEVDGKILTKMNILDIINGRRSNRKYTENALSFEELSFLLWSTQGVKKITANNYSTLRTVPSGGARHPFETYLVVNKVQGLKKGVYRYLSLTHKLLFMYDDENLEENVIGAAMDQPFVGRCAVTFIWSCVPYRGEWRYNISAHKTMLLDAGHMCQNLYIACEAIDCGTCAIGAYDQALADKLLGLDGDDEFVVYMAPVGKVDRVFHI